MGTRGISESYERKGTKSEKEQKTRHAGRELHQTEGVAYVGNALRVKVEVYASRRIATASPIFYFTLDKVGVLEYSRSVTQKINLALAWRSLGIAWHNLSL